MKSYLKYISEKTFSDFSGGEKNKWVNLHLQDLSALTDDPDVRKELFDLISKSYAYTEAGRHTSIPTASHIPGKYTLWKAIDIDDDPEPDIVKFGTQEKYGNKWAGGATDMSSQAKELYIDYTLRVLTEPGNYVEASDAIAKILMENKIPFIADEDTVRKILNKNIQWVGKTNNPRFSDFPEYDGWYERLLGDDKYHEKLLFGRPKL